MTKKVRILLVDDEKEFLDSISERVKLKGFEPILATSGEEALELAREHRIELAVVDLKMPGMDGLVTIQKLKEINPKLHTTLLTAYGDEKVQQATEGLDSEYFEKDDMDSFWSFLKRIPKTLEDSMAAAGIATGGDLDDAAHYSEDYEDEDK
ncbi:response regulator [Desulfohalovibrio reitneri]|uniref:response regulator n=1 Tax=Desulfohalovibrio reitneri TaxID=1307759 RepID=UPI0004A783AC|nr:response regulator [Desulfohalovibrio reitneri]